jgi:hypothetical protein
MPALWTEPAILHATIALSAAHQNELPCHQRLLGNQNNFALMQYTKAIGQVRSLLATSNNMSIAVVLITCVLFTFLEYIRGQYSAAATHLHNGLKLLRSINLPRFRSVGGILLIKAERSKGSIDVDIIQSFATLHFQADLLGNHIPDVALLLQATETEMPSPKFTSLEEAKYSLDKLIHGILMITQRMKSSATSTDERVLSPPVDPKVAGPPLATWRLTYETTIVDIAPGAEREQLGYKLLLNYHIMANIMCRNFQTTSETAYEAFTNEFILIIQRSIVIHSHYMVNHGNDLSGMISDLGWIPPLFYTALKCRIHRIRLHAIKLLRSISRREGVWDSNLAASVAEKVMEIEEEPCILHPCNDEFPLDEVPDAASQDSNCPSESSLFYEVQVDMQDATRLAFTGKRRTKQGITQALRFHFDGRHWKESHVE